MARGKVLTTGEVAKVCSVAPRTVSKWFDTGQLRGYRIPGSKDRRIPVEHLIRFMRLHGMPLDALDHGITRVLVLDSDRSLFEAIQTALPEANGYDVISADSPFEAGVLFQQIHPHVMLVDVALPNVEPASIVRCLRTWPDMVPVRLIGMSDGITSAVGEGLKQDGFDDYLSKPFDAQALLRVFEQEGTPA